MKTIIYIEITTPDGEKIGYVSDDTENKIRAAMLKADEMEHNCIWEVYPIEVVDSDAVEEGARLIFQNY